MVLVRPGRITLLLRSEVRPRPHRIPEVVVFLLVWTQVASWSATQITLKVFRDQLLMDAFPGTLSELKKGRHKKRYQTYVLCDVVGAGTRRMHTGRRFVVQAGRHRILRLLFM